MTFASSHVEGRCDLQQIAGRKYVFGGVGVGGGGWLYQGRVVYQLLIFTLFTYYR